METRSKGKHSRTQPKTSNAGSYTRDAEDYDVVSKHRWSRAVNPLDGKFYVIPLITNKVRNVTLARNTTLFSVVRHPDAWRNRLELLKRRALLHVKSMNSEITVEHLFFD